MEAGEVTRLLGQGRKTLLFKAQEAAWTPLCLCWVSLVPAWGWYRRAQMVAVHTVGSHYSWGTLTLRSLLFLQQAVSKPALCFRGSHYIISQGCFLSTWPWGMAPVKAVKALHCRQTSQGMEEPERPTEDCLSWHWISTSSGTWRTTR